MTTPGAPAYLSRSTARKAAARIMAYSIRVACKRISIQDSMAHMVQTLLRANSET